MKNQHGLDSAFFKLRLRQIADKCAGYNAVKLIQELEELSALAHKQVAYREGSPCPFCGNNDASKFSKKRSDKTFYSRVGCLNCDTWLEPMRIKEDSP